MEKISNNSRINQINIPGTHDSGSYNIDKDGLPILNLFRGWWGKTQNLDIYEQLIHGIRYFDIRIETNSDKEIYISHGGLNCINKKTGNLYYLSDVFDEVIEFFTL